jgi:hypothetical protein
MQDERDLQRQKVIAAIAARLERVRGTMTDAEFGQLLARMARTAERFAEIDAKPGWIAPAMADDEIQRLLDIPPG